MRTPVLISIIATTLLTGVSLSALAAGTIGKAAPAFALTDSDGKTRQLSEFKGKTVVLEWTNPDCPFVRKHYGAGNMQAQQADAVSKEIVWLSINSSAPGKEGHLNGDQANSYRQQVGAKQTAYLLDPSGETGHHYGAKTTPHMFVIDGNGILRYDGAIDSIASTDKEDISKATQYVSQALAEMAANKPVSVSTSKPYGCSVKYRD